MLRERGYLFKDIGAIFGVGKVRASQMVAKGERIERFGFSKLQEQEDLIAWLRFLAEDK